MASQTNPSVGVDPLLGLCLTQIRLSADRIAALQTESHQLRQRAAELEANNEALQARIADLEGKVAARRAPSGALANANPRRSRLVSS